jgi:hypothetical protein
MNPPPRRHARRGVVLFEVIMALTVFTLVAVSLVMALDATMDATSQRAQTEIALRGLENQMALVRNIRLVPGETDVPDDGTGVAYTVLVEPTQMKDQKNVPVPNIFRVTITAKWKDGAHDEDREVSELIYQP